MNATAATVAAVAVPAEKMAAGLLQTNLTLQNWARPTELTIDYTIPELIHSIELVQRQVRIQWSHYSQKRSARWRRGTEGNLRMGTYGCAMCVNEQTGICNYRKLALDAY